MKILMVLSGLFTYIVNLSLGLAAAYIVSSLLASAVKLDQGDCGKKYVIEKYIVGDLFCEESE